MDFIVVEDYSPYMAILVRSWLHVVGIVSSNLHVKLKYPIEEGVRELLGCQAMHGSGDQALSISSRLLEVNSYIIV